VTLASVGSANGGNNPNGVQMLVLADGTDAVYSVATYVDAAGLGFVWIRQQLSCERISS